MHSPRKRRLLLGTLLTLAILGVLLGVFLNPLAAWGTRRALSELKGFSSDFQSVSLSLVPLRYEITELKLFEEPPAARASSSTPSASRRNCRSWTCCAAGSSARCASRSRGFPTCCARR
ncbi:hypothetical protein ACN28S_49980 [Cystobacter fuscus]